MIKLIACAIPILLFIFGQPVLGVIFLGVPIWVFTVSWIIKRNKQRPDESDEDYAKRITSIQATPTSMSFTKYEDSTKGNPCLDPMLSMLPNNIYNPNRFKNNGL